MTAPEHGLFSAYPLSDALHLGLQRCTRVPLVTYGSLAEMKTESVMRIVSRLRQIRADTLWIAVSDFDYQPLLPLLRLLASLTSARRLRVIDFEGRSRAISRAGSLLGDPLRLAWWSLHGLRTLASMRRETVRLLRLPRIETGPVPRQGRIAYLKTHLWFGVQVGGSVGHVAGVANGLARAGWTTEMLSVDTPPLLDSSVRLRRLQPRDVAGLPLELGRYQYHRSFSAAAEAALAAQPPDVLYHRLWVANYAGVVLSRRFRVPLVLEYNGSEVWAARHWGMAPTFAGVAERIEAVNLRHAHLVVVVSEVLRQELLARGVPDERIVCHPNGIDPEIFDPARFTEADRRAVRRGWDVPQDAIVVAFLGTFGLWHGAEVLAEAARKLVSERRDWVEQRRLRFIFVGDGPRLPAVRERLVDVPDHLYRLTGLVEQAAAARHLAAADILASPHMPNPDGSRFFGSPTKLFEYMAMDKAIVASELEQIGEVLAGSPRVADEPLPEVERVSAAACAVLTTPGSAAELAAAIAHLAERRELRDRLGAAARRRVLERYTWARHVDAILTRLATVLTPTSG